MSLKSATTKSLLILLAILLPLIATSQRSRFQVELFGGGQYIYHHECALEDKSIHRGYTGSSGIRLNFDLSKRFTIIGGYTVNNLLGDNTKFPLERVFRVDIRYNIGHFKKVKKLNFTVETGAELNQKNMQLNIPIYLGTMVHINPMLDWNTRFSPPNFMVLTDFVGTFNFVTYRVETGIAWRIYGSSKPKFIARSGNPFILE